MGQERTVILAHYFSLWVFFEQFATVCSLQRYVYFWRFFFFLFEIFPICGALAVVLFTFVYRPHMNAVELMVLFLRQSFPFATSLLPLSCKCVSCVYARVLRFIGCCLSRRQCSHLGLKKTRLFVPCILSPVSMKTSGAMKRRCSSYCHPLSSRQTVLAVLPAFQYWMLSLFLQGFPGLVFRVVLFLGLLIYSFPTISHPIAQYQPRLLLLFLFWLRE